MSAPVLRLCYYCMAPAMLHGMCAHHAAQLGPEFAPTLAPTAPKCDCGSASTPGHEGLHADWCSAAGARP